VDTTLRVEGKSNLHKLAWRRPYCNANIGVEDYILEAFSVFTLTWGFKILRSLLLLANIINDKTMLTAILSVGLERRPLRFDSPLNFLQSRPASIRSLTLRSLVMGSYLVDDNADKMVGQRQA
jgi:hypothetical protein